MTVTTDPTPVVIDSFSEYMSGNAFAANGLALGTPASAVWPSASLALYFPLRLPFAYACQRVFVCNGAAVAGNISIALYNEDFTQAGSTGAVAQAGLNANQYVAFAVNIAAGSYYLGISLSNAAGTTIRTNVLVASQARFFGVLQQAGANPLPNPMVPAVDAQTYWPLFGLTRAASGF